MNFVEVPTDITKIKTKVIFNLTKRQLICFSLAGIVSLPTYLLNFKKLGTNTSIYLMLTLAIPFFVFAFYEKNGKGLEKHLFHILNFKLMKKTRKRKGVKGLGKKE